MDVIIVIVQELEVSEDEIWTSLLSHRHGQSADSHLLGLEHFELSFQYKVEFIPVLAFFYEVDVLGHSLDLDYSHNGKKCLVTVLLLQFRKVVKPKEELAQICKVSRRPLGCGLAQDGAQVAFEHYLLLGVPVPFNEMFHD